MSALRSDLARELRERLTNAVALAQGLGLRAAPRATARQVTVSCPWHDENTPSCVVRVAKDGTIAVRCHGCGATGDALTLIAQVHRLDLDGDFPEVLRHAAELAGAPGLVDVASVGPGPKKAREPEPQSVETYHAIWNYIADECAPMRSVAPNVAAYLTFRKIFADAEAAGCFGFPTDARKLVADLLANFERSDLDAAGALRGGEDGIDWPAWPLAIPWRDRFGRIHCVQRRRIINGKPRYLSPKGRSPRAPFGAEHLADALSFHGRHAEIVIVEGALDCCARRRIARAQGERAAIIGVYSASAPLVGLPLDLFQGRRVVLALDDDAEGDRACDDKLEPLIRGVAGEVIRERPPAKDWLQSLCGGAS
jgi:DNA primase